MQKTRILQVKDFNATVDVRGLDRNYWMTTGTGAQHEPLRKNGWVVFQSRTLGDSHDFAKWFSNFKQAQAEWKVRT